MSARTKISALDLHFYLGMYHGILAIILGSVLILDPNKSEPKLTYMMGAFWLAGGIALLRQDPGQKLSRRLSQVMSVVAVLTGMLVMVRYFASTVFGLDVVDNPIVNVVLGAVILLTGAFHFYAELALGARASLRRFLHYFLALFEILLGLQLILLPVIDHLFVRQTITIWAFLGGIVYITTALYDRNEKRKVTNVDAADGAAGEPTAAADQRSTAGEQSQ